MRRLLWGVALASMLATSGCGGDGSAESGPSRPDSSALESEDSTSTAATASTTAEATPSVEPATGPLVDMEHLSFRLPKGWKVYDEMGAVVTAAPKARGDRRILGVAVLPTSNTQAEVLATALEDIRGDGKVRQLPDLELPGCTAYQLASFDRVLREFRYDVACVTGLKLYSFKFTDPEGELASAQELTAPVFASMEMG